MSIATQWYWKEPVNLLEAILTVFDLPSRGRRVKPDEIEVLLERPLPDGRERFAQKVATGGQFRAYLAAEGVLSRTCRIASTDLPMMAYLFDEDRPSFVYPATVLGAAAFDVTGASMTQNRDFPHLFYPDTWPDSPVPPEMLERFRAKYLPLNQAFWLSELCTLILRLQPAAVMVAREFETADDLDMWDGAGARLRVPTERFVLAFAAEGVPVEGLPRSLPEVKFGHGRLLYVPAVFRCDVAAVAAKVQAPGYDFDQEWEPLRRAWANGRPTPPAEQGDEEGV